MKPNTPEWLEWEQSGTSHGDDHVCDHPGSAGREDVYSICGDVPSADYQLASNPSMTLRLCR
jgi:hypothetical protein